MTGRSKANPPSDMARTAAMIGVATATVAAAGAFMLARRSRHPDIATDAPHWTLDSANQGANPVIGETLLINADREDLYERWLEVEEFPRFMENVESVAVRDDDVSCWLVKAPAGRSVTLVNRMTRREDGKSISWQSEEESDIANSGKVSFDDAPGDRGTYVTLVVSYDPPAGTLGRLFAKLFQREPSIQARRDLRRFKQLVETGEVSTNASPSGRQGESPTEAHL